MTVGENIRRIRQEQGLTQKQLSKLCGIDAANIRKYESGRQKPKQETLLKMAKALRVHLKDLVDSSIWEEYDHEHPQQIEANIQSVQRIEAMEAYLERMGFEVKFSQTGADEYEVLLSKEGNTAIFTSKEFDNLILCAKEAIEGGFYKKVLEQQRGK